VYVRKILNYLPKLASFAMRNFASARWVVALALFGVGVEYATLTIMIPLAASRSIGVGAAVTSIWRAVARAIGLPDTTRTWLWLFLLLLGLRILLGLAQVTLNAFVGKKIMAYLCGSAVERVVMHEPLDLIYKRSVGHYLAMTGDEALRVGQIFFNSIQLFSGLLAAFIGLIALYFFSPLALEFTAIFLVLSAISLLAITSRVFAESGNAARLSRQVSTTFVETINGIRSIRSMAGEAFVANRFRDIIQRYTRTLFRLDMYNHSSRTLPGVMLIVVGLVVLYPRLGLFEDVSTMFFFSVVAILIRILSFLGEAVTAGGRVIADVRVAFELDDVLENALGSSFVNGEQEEVAGAAREITFHDLIYSYKPHQPVISGISGRFVAGKCYALVGRSGSGKSTLADLILGLLKPQFGNLSLNGVAYSEMSVYSIRRKVILVEQETRIFSGTIWDNIAFGLSAMPTEMADAIKTAGLAEFVETLPDGLQTRLEYQGSNLSGGQRQRIGLARALVRNPDVLVLDEATSALDGSHGFASLASNV
jgi:ABC-type bacteriocin/lantibiotic exporter with double-glycine peptidase domain